MINPQSITNILQVLYEESPVVRTYVDTIALGNPVSYDIIARSTDFDKNEKIVQTAKDTYYELNKIKPEMRDSETDSIIEFLGNLLDLEFVLEDEDELYEVVMFNGDAIVEGSRQIVKGNRISDLKAYAIFKGYELSVKKVIKE